MSIDELRKQLQIIFDTEEKLTKGPPKTNDDYVCAFGYLSETIRIVRRVVAEKEEKK